MLVKVKVTAVNIMTSKCTLTPEDKEKMFTNSCYVFIFLLVLLALCFD